MSIRESRQRSRRSRSRRNGGLSSPSPVPHSARTRRCNKLSLRRRRRLREERSAPQVQGARAPQASPEAVIEPTQVSGLAAQCLSELTGLTPAMEKQLHAMGQSRFFQVAHWSEESIAHVASTLGVDAAQIRDANWIGQARRRG